ncbi:alpha-beta hydrolase superfamily lysophospholipase [Streptosporangium becharense]|uniref:Alpha-beta hydrolase superfamily lysophospholipase n=1 Tax=Streptosporangium becharense TaxID=1816182 RepID=A0A7W9IKY9_9ACTN|nr:alpha/beta hydrolase [Streptosporangium becharense]MBB2911575.1 alpha-beta hydrolase superfamily lysophospholipase [Streptosporangium becharense]MBB5822607.1 alpha-beta hydrolase superfamily lysophospholipase [Streptosporangium becharense]
MPDVLGPDYELTVLPMADDYEGTVVASLVRRRAADPTGRAVLYLHGFTDYFFQTHLADHFVARGTDFYGLDLRKYGRSLLPHQTRGFVRSVTEYFPEIDEAVRIIRERDGHDEVVLNAHSTGGLIAALWADRVRGRGLVQGLVLNSPFFDLNVPAYLRRAADALRGPLSRLPVGAVLPLGVATAYGASLHRSHHGEWDFDLEWKPIGGFPVHAAWLSAIRRAQLRLHGGLRVDVPVLVLCAADGLRLRDFTPEARGADVVLDPRQIARWSTSVGPHVTCVRVPGGMHDLVLSPAPVRERVLAEMDRWIDAYL